MAPMPRIALRTQSLSRTLHPQLTKLQS